MRRFLMCFAAIATLAFASVQASSKNIDLSTIPPRDSVQLTIYNDADLTLVRETRHVSFKKGTNRLQFSWANTLIDPTSVQLKFLDQPHRLTLLDTTYPHDKPQMLYWNINSEFAGEAELQISYFTSGISWRADYIGIADPDETQMQLTGHVTVTNQSGEDYEDAHIRLVVGKINLVEKIRTLAQQGMGGQPQVPGQRGQYRNYAMRESLKMAERARAEADHSSAPEDAKQIVKEGLSEYFIFSIEGRETVSDTWAKRMQSFEAGEAPIRVQYRYRPREYGEQLVRMFLLKNNEDAGMGDAPLPNGNVRLFRRTGDDGLNYLTRQSIDYIPIGEDIELNLGPDDEVIFEQKKMRAYRDNIWANMHRGGVRQRLDQPGQRIQGNATVVGWDQHTVYHQRIRNYTDTAIDVQIRRQYTGDVIFKSQLGPSLHDYQTVQFDTQLEAGQSTSLPYEVIVKHGENAEQNRVKLQDGAPAPLPWAQED